MDLSAYLKTHNISRATFAATLRTSRQNVSRWCEGVMPRREDIVKIMAETKGEVTPTDFAFAKPVRPAKSKPVPAKQEGQAA